ncbi:hypothetical protein A3A11_01910 [Candidatus Nomurabacteria bacterium RIFCSPLOWO2_01_FULL_43_15]|nr:MAG: hypothetical protein A3A11_01910 [Candidatus Nomurabacteria bacterium RIFCSPLOWO2_01_FULL_43_15]
MKNIQTPENQPSPIENKSKYIILKLRKPKPLVIAIVIAAFLALILTALFFAKGLFIAATLNGSPISRLSVIKDLEKQGGKQTLEVIITQKLINTELAKQNISVTKEEVDQEIKKIEAQVTSQGGTLKDALAQQNMTEEKLREQITIQKKLEKVLADKVAVSDTEIDAYIKENKTTPPKDVKVEDFKKQIGDQLKQQKFQQVAQKWVSDLKTNAKINYYVNY